jgi:predicted ATPase
MIFMNCKTTLSGLHERRRFCALLQATATKEQPLVMFLDDIQWADTASLSLIHYLISNLSGRNTAVSGKVPVLLAYRENEVHQAHPMELEILRMEEQGIIFSRLHVENLDVQTLNELVACLTGRRFGDALPLLQ